MRMVEGYHRGRDLPERRQPLSRDSTATATPRRRISGPAMAEASGKPIDRILPTFVDQPGVPLLDGR